MSQTSLYVCSIFRLCNTAQSLPPTPSEMTSETSENRQGSAPPPDKLHTPAIFPSLPKNLSLFYRLTSWLLNPLN